MSNGDVAFPKQKIAAFERGIIGARYDRRTQCLLLHVAVTWTSDTASRQRDPHVDRRVHIGESCTLIGWPISVSGRKHEAGTAVFDGKGELCGRARALWIEPRSSATVSELPPAAR